nr:D217 [uncultured bacterium]
MGTPQPVPASAPAQGLGWRLGALPTAATLSHLGYTGTALWIDPPSQTYVIVLTNRVLDGARGDAGPLRQAIIAQVTDWLTRSPALARALPNAPAGVVLPGIDTLARRDFAPLRGRRIGLITNHTGVDLAGRRSLDVLRQVPRLTLAALFSPEHGLAGTANERVASSIDARSGLVVYSLYGKTLRPTPAMLAGLDALVFDIQDAGTRYYTYLTTLGYAMEAAAARGIPFYVLDRPDPLTADVVQGPPLDADLRSFTGYFPMPVRYGMTVGEVARMFNGELGIGAQLQVVPMSGYRRGDWYDATGLPWIAPSPNLPGLTAATLYPAVGLIEGANVSVGRGTPTPFELLGAPWIDGAELAAYLAQRTIAGVAFASADFTPVADRFRGQDCHGVSIHLVDRQTLDAPALGVELASALQRLYPQRFRLGDTLSLVGSRQVLAAIRAGTDPRSIVAGWQDTLTAFERQRAKYLLYR